LINQEDEMSEKRASLEVIAPTVEEAVASGLADLGLPREAVEVEVLDEGARGLFGLGSRQARVRLKIKAAISAERKSPEETPIAQPTNEAIASEDISSLQETEAPSVAPAEQKTVSRHIETAAQAVTETTEKIEGEEAGEDHEMILRIARETVEELLDRMKVQASVTARFGEPDDARSRAPLLVDVRGDDLAILIGRKAETLNALQYITSLIVGKELGRAVPLVVDVEGYRERRSREVRQLARRMAEQAIKTGRRQYLEPMPANERRLVHIELRDNPDVYTESTGEDPRRKVMVIPKD
jgi:spoIIIJ-associated protein